MAEIRCDSIKITEHPIVWCGFSLVCFTLGCADSAMSMVRKSTGVLSIWLQLGWPWFLHHVVTTGMSITQMEPCKAWPIYKYILLLIILTWTMLFHWAPLKTVQVVKRNHCLSTTKAIWGFGPQGASHYVFFFLPVVPFFLKKLCVLGMQVGAVGLGDRRHWNPGTRVTSGCESPDPDAGDWTRVQCAPLTTAPTLCPRLLHLENEWDLAWPRLPWKAWVTHPSVLTLLFSVNLVNLEVWINITKDV